MGQYFARETGHIDEGNPRQRDISGEGQKKNEERHIYARCGTKVDER